jgi:alpha-glucosidase (family GH31 glycosyl hydrolase)
LADDLLSYERYGIPVGVYHFDRPWAVGAEGYGDFFFDPARFPSPPDMLHTMVARGWHVLVWASPWAIGTRGDEARAKGYLAPGGDGVRDLDFTNPEAVAWLQGELHQFLTGPEGRYVDGFFLDRGDETQPSRAEDVYRDGRNGRQVHNAYAVLYAKAFREALDEARGGSGFQFARAAFTGEQVYAAKYGGDTHNRDGLEIPEVPNTGAPTDNGLRSAIISLQRCAFMGIPYWGSNVGGISDIADRENFARWLEVGAAMPIMFVFGKGTHAPWSMPNEPHFDQELLDIYRRSVLLHHALGDYLYSLAEVAHRTGLPVGRPLVFRDPDDPATKDRWDEWMLGDDLLVAPVWQSGVRSRQIYLPAGRWIDFWDRSRTLEGPVEFTESVALDRLPLFAAAGSRVLEIQPPP